VLRYLRRFDELPDHTDQLFVVDRDERLQGRAAARVCCWSPTRTSLVADMMMRDEPLTLHPDEKAQTTRRRPSSATTWCRRRWSTRTASWSAG
jgi:magnesium transporter